MRMTDIIEKKRYGNELDDREIRFFVSGVTDKSIPDYQICALLMAIVLNGMNERETLTLTTEMAKSGDILDLSDLENTVDKHSTGGVGDKTTLVVAPIAAALGCTVAKMSGRGLGFTGGTVDKLQSITGYNISLPTEKFKENARKYGMCVVGQSGNFAPADKRLYALRDVTATVDSIPLIASSIMSKKLAAGAETIVLDVKYGSGAFMKTPADTQKLALSMVKIGKGAGRKMSALITDMDVPLGFNIGNSLEVMEAVKVLKGEGPDDLTELCISITAQMYSKSFSLGKVESISAVKRVIADGSAFETLCKAVAAQDGDEKLLTGEHEFKKPESCTEVFAPKSGYISLLNSQIIGKASSVAGAGRERLDDTVDYTAGIVLDKKYGEYIKKGERLATVYGKKEKTDAAAEELIKAYGFSTEKPDKKPLVYKIID